MIMHPGTDLGRGNGSLPGIECLSVPERRGGSRSARSAADRHRCRGRAKGSPSEVNDKSRFCRQLVLKRLGAQSVNCTWLLVLNQIPLACLNCNGEYALTTLAITNVFCNVVMRNVSVTLIGGAAQHLVGWHGILK